jgi:hypothetical protein
VKPSQLRFALLLLLSSACSGKVVLGGLPEGAGGGRDAATGGGQGADPVDPCAQTTQQATAILSKHCALCHQGAPNVAGQPLNFILDFARLETDAPSANYAGKAYLVPGDPAASLIYYRSVVVRDMPLRDGLEPPNWLSTSEGSLLQYWITSCLN